MNAFLGIDVSSTDLEVCIVNDASKMTKTKTFEYTNKGMKKLIALAKRSNVTSVTMEATGGHEKRIAYAFRKEDFDVTVANPAQIRNFAKGIGILAKTDKIDAFAIARFAQVVKPKPTHAKIDEEIDLTALAKRKNDLDKMMQAEKNRLKLADKIAIPSLKTHIKFLEKQIILIKEKMETVIKNSEKLTEQTQILTKQKGFGMLTAMLLLAHMPEWGLLNHKETASLAGLAPVARDSGKMRGKRIIMGGRANLRKALYMPALVAMRHDEKMKELYERLLDKGKPKKVAIVAVMRHLLVKANAVMRDEFYKQKKIAS